MAIIGFIFAFLFSLYVTAAGGFMIFAASVFGSSSEKKIGVIILAIGLFLGYLTLTNAPFQMIMLK